MKNYSVDIGDAELNVVEAGDGETTLVFLHYWGGSSRTFQPVMQLLSDRFRCIAFDQRGWGRSSKAGDFSLGSYASDTGRLIEKLGIKTYILVGHSMGGKVCQLVASRRPPGLRGLALLAPAPATAIPAPEDQRRAMLASYQTAEGVEAALSVLSGKPLDDRFRQQVIEDTLIGASGAKAIWTTEGMIEDISPEASRIAVPTVIIVGERDGVEPEDRLRRDMPKVIPQATFEVLPGLGHLAPLEGPADVAAALRRFAARLSEPGIVAAADGDEAL